MTRTTFGPQVSSDEDIGSRYASLANTINFGIPETSKSSHGFSIPVVVFNFKSAFGTDITGGSPTLKIRAPSSLSLQHNSNYDRGGNIFGGSQMSFNEAPEGANASFKFLDQTGNTLAEAIAKKIMGAAGGKMGYLESAGQSGIDQFEFANRSVINPFSQLLYKGPNFKQYNLPFVMRPKNIDEARAAMGIISAFKIASSPKVAGGTYEDVDAPGDPSVFGTITNAIVDSIPLTFGYPDLVSFEIYMYSGTECSAPIYTSLNCAIMSVSTDYGQQKMSFFIPDSGENKYYPTEIAMTIGLQEVEFRTTYDAEQEVTSNTTLR
jgi:hypothetical protein